jgi:hypothetical protein
VRDDVRDEGRGERDKGQGMRDEGNTRKPCPHRVWLFRVRMVISQNKIDF